jgi:hypothetical protein
MNGTSQHRLLCLSGTPADPEPAHLTQIFGHAGIVARRLDITGALIYTGSHFVEVLEGESRGLLDFLRTVGDCRFHGEPRIVLRRQIILRLCDAWSATCLASASLSAEVRTLAADSAVPDAVAESLALRLCWAVARSGA